jgi:hypothetical protein
LTRLSEIGIFTSPLHDGGKYPGPEQAFRSVQRRTQDGKEEGKEEREQEA